MLTAVWIASGWEIIRDCWFWIRCRHDSAIVMVSGRIVALKSRRSKTAHAPRRTFASRVARTYLLIISLTFIIMEARLTILVGSWASDPSNRIVPYNTAVPAGYEISHPKYSQSRDSCYEVCGVTHKIWLRHILSHQFEPSHGKHEDCPIATCPQGLPFCRHWSCKSFRTYVSQHLRKYSSWQPYCWRLWLAHDEAVVDRSEISRERREEGEVDIQARLLTMSSTC